MRIGMIGLGKMGGNMAQRLTMGGHEVIAYDPHPPDAARVQERPFRRRIGQVSMSSRCAANVRR